MDALELREETLVVFGEETEVFCSILEVGDTLYPQAKGVATVLLGVYFALTKHIRIDHTAAQDLYPTGVLTEGTALSSTDITAYIHLGTWLCKGEVTRAQTDLRIGAE